MKPNPVGWFEIYVQDMARARRFYETVLDGKIEKLDATDLDMYAFPSQQGGSGSAGALVRMQGVPSGGNSVLVYFHVEDCAVEEGRVVKAGGSIHKAKFSIAPYGFISLCVDTEENMFGLHSMK
jgi:predicted enzyme related to lactoylglutathione lyase